MTIYYYYVYSNYRPRNGCGANLTRKTIQGTKGLDYHRYMAVYSTTIGNKIRHDWILKVFKWIGMLTENLMTMQKTKLRPVIV